MYTQQKISAATDVPHRIFRSCSLKSRRDGTASA